MSTGLNNIKQLTPSNQAISDLRELLFLEVLEMGSIAETLNFQYGVRNGKVVGGIGEFDMLGESKAMCNPTFNSTKLNVQEKIWELGKLVIAEEMCADDFEETVAKFAMQTGTDKADLTQTDLLSHIIEPRLREAMEKAIWRYMWFNDTDAANKAAGGLVTDGIDTKYFTAMDGLFKRLYEVTTNNADRYVKIAANDSATTKDQMDDMFQLGAATKVIDDLVYSASMKLRQRGDKMIFCTQSFADALAADVKNSNKGSDLQWEYLFDGLVATTRYNGQKIVALPIWDEMIASYENHGTKLHKPHRVLFAAKDALWGGVESVNDFMPNLRIWFSNDTQTNRILGREEMGTMVWQDELIQFAH